MYRNPFENQSGAIGLPAIVAAGFTERQYNAHGVLLNYVVGPNNGPALVLIPAQMGTWESYYKVLPRLTKNFQVYAIDIRGHGKSSWTPGDYSWQSIGKDMEAFLRSVVKRPAIICGNSSGGIIALWCGANLPNQTAGVILEDTPVFSAEMPRFKERDKYVYGGLQHAVTMIGDLEHRDLANYFKGLELPVSENRVKRIPDFFVHFLSKRIAKAQRQRPGQPLTLQEWYIPKNLKLLFKSLSMFDPDFARAFVDGRFYGSFSHEKALQKRRCPLLVMHADWHRYKRFGLVGAMDGTDAQKIKQLVPTATYKQIHANHVIHMYKPDAFVQAITSFATSQKLLQK